MKKICSKNQNKKKANNKKQTEEFDVRTLLDMDAIVFLIKGLDFKQN